MRVCVGEVLRILFSSFGVIGEFVYSRIRFGAHLKMHRYHGLLLINGQYANSNKAKLTISRYKERFLTCFRSILEVISVEISYSTADTFDKSQQEKKRNFSLSTEKRNVK